MTHRLDVARGRDVVTRWCALAEQRLEHLTELFETGRWRRYHSEVVFLENIQEAKNAVEAWRNLLAYEKSPWDARRPVPVRLQTVPRAPAETVRSIASILPTSPAGAIDEIFSAQALNHQPSNVQDLRVPETASSGLLPHDMDLAISNDAYSENAGSQELDSQELDVEDLDSRDMGSRVLRKTAFDIAAITLDFEAMKNRYPLLRNSI